MRIATMAFAATLLAAGVAYAQDAGWAPEFIKTAKPADYMAAYPPRALAEKVSGEAVLECKATADGRLADCTVASETPADYGFGEAALKVVDKERIKTKDKDGKSVAGRTLKTFLPFLAPGDSNADWLDKPTEDELVAVYPTAAMKKGLDGVATLNCGVTVEGFLENCKVVAEEPEGIGFGAAALQLVPQLRMKPRIRGGKAVAGSATFRVPWLNMRDMRGETSARKVILDPPWTATPTSMAVRDAWPAKDREKAGSAAVSCRLTPEGGLKMCRTLSETPDGRGFGRAAVKLAQAFKVRLTPEEAKDAEDYWVDIPFRFRNPTEPDTRKVTKPKWIRALTPEGARAVFPQQAKAASVYNGLGTINCLVAVGGRLTDCNIVREEPAALGFGEAALKAAEYMTMNPWSVDGDPLDGLRVTVPIRLVIDPPTSADGVSTPAP